ncbi:MAG: hypothetical protein R2883_04820 [Caldisericia bacterium]
MKIGKVGLLAAFALGLFVVVILLLKLMWAWVIPDLFPGAVEQGLIAANISWFTALKVGLFTAILGGFAASKHTINQKNN